MNKIIFESKIDNPKGVCEIFGLTRERAEKIEEQISKIISDQIICDFDIIISCNKIQHDSKFISCFNCGETLEEQLYITYCFKEIYSSLNDAALLAFKLLGE